MGMYVNPSNEEKETFLNREGMLVSKNISWKDVSKGYLPVVLMNNGPFTAAGVAYNESELTAFTGINDLRPRQIFMVKIEKLIPVVGAELERYVKDNDLS